MDTVRSVLPRRGQVYDLPHNSNSSGVEYRPYLVVSSNSVAMGGTVLCCRIATAESELCDRVAHLESSVKLPDGEPCALGRVVTHVIHTFTVEKLPLEYWTRESLSRSTMSEVSAALIN